MPFLPCSVSASCIITRPTLVPLSQQRLYYVVHGPSWCWTVGPATTASPLQSPPKSCRQAMHTKHVLPNTYLFPCLRRVWHAAEASGHHETEYNTIVKWLQGAKMQSLRYKKKIITEFKIKSVKMYTINTKERSWSGTKQFSRTILKIYLDR